MSAANEKAGAQPQRLRRLTLGDVEQRARLFERSMLRDHTTEADWRWLREAARASGLYSYEIEPTTVSARRSVWRGAPN